MPSACARVSASRRDFGERIKRIHAALPRIERLAEETRAEIMKTFEERIRELLAALPVNEKRLYEEASIASQHGDISEEITRLRIHLEGLDALLDRKGPVGKSIEFLLQEINREVNTMGSKSQNAALSQADGRSEGRGGKDARAGAKHRIVRSVV